MCIRDSTKTERKSLSRSNRECFGFSGVKYEGRRALAGGRAAHQTIYYHWLKPAERSLYIINLLTHDFIRKELPFLEGPGIQGARSLTVLNGDIYIMGLGPYCRSVFRCEIVDGEGDLFGMVETPTLGPVEGIPTALIDQISPSTSGMSNTQIRYSKVDEMIYGRTDFTVVLSGDSDIFIIGGKSFDPKRKWNECELFSIKSPEESKALAPLQFPRTNFGACLFNNDFILAFGGTDALGAPVNQVERYSIYENTWEVLDCLHEPIVSVSNLGCFQVDSDKLLIVGGCNLNGQTVRNNCYWISTDGERCTKAPSLPYATAMNNEFLFFDREFYVSGELRLGFENNPRFLLRFDIPNHLWTLEWYERQSNKKKGVTSKVFRVLSLIHI
eukprot:TRINITY_DN12201_c0_g1_i1.p1 TRINITY_DN12201_c0_g1~~TRINITY_DN12201_c0_g1_i1.p1  ORF type:complete len:405 (+),score=23.13 TRINITY_DN12201_c0_g1_i1:59-1216(+)